MNGVCSRQRPSRGCHGGGTIGNSGYFVPPTVLINIKPEMKLAREEIFGPVLVAERYNDDDLDWIAKEANGTTYGQRSRFGSAISPSHTTWRGA